MDLNSLRSEIDQIDEQLTELFVRRMQISSKIAECKKETGVPIHVPAREKEKLLDVAKKAGPEMGNYTQVLYSMLFELSRSYQSKRNSTSTPLFQKISNSINSTPSLFPPCAPVACQGCVGTYAQLASEKIFKKPLIMYFSNTDAVFRSVEQGLCSYGIVPIENSTAGSSKHVYDLIIQHQFSIIRSYQMKTNHSLLALPNTTLSGIKEIYSHQQTINQCSEFLQTLKDIKIIPLENTAAAAEIVAKSGRTDIAALASPICTQIYGLTSLADSVHNKGKNHSRFICISKNLEIYPGADRTSIMMVLPHKPGALYKVLARLYVLGINILKLESRPLADRDIEFSFYFDLETSVYSDEFAQLMCELDDLCLEFHYLGSYTEVV